MNKVLELGRLVRDPETNNSATRFTLAVDRKFKKEGEPTADFIPCKAFGKLSEIIEKYAKKGTKLAIEGRWQTGSYTKDDKTVYTNELIVESMEFAESKKSEEKEPEDFIPVPEGTDLPF